MKLAYLFLYLGWIALQEKEYIAMQFDTTESMIRLCIKEPLYKQFVTNLDGDIWLVCKQQQDTSRNLNCMQQFADYLG